jgi:hypothetical protein
VNLDIADYIKTGNALIYAAAVKHCEPTVSGRPDPPDSVEGLPPDAQFIDDPDRPCGRIADWRVHRYAIPRGQRSTSSPRTAAFRHGIGIRHLYVDDLADLKALGSDYQCQVQRPTDNASDTVLIHRNCAAEFLPFRFHLRGLGSFR